MNVAGNRLAEVAVGRIEMKRLRRLIETDEYHLNYVTTKLARA